MNLNLDPTRHSVRHMMVAGSLGVSALIGLQVPAGTGDNDVSCSGVGGAGAFIPMALPSYCAADGTGEFAPVVRAIAQRSSAAGGAGAFIPMAPPSAASHPAAGGAGAFIPMGP